MLSLSYLVSLWLFENYSSQYHKSNHISILGIDISQANPFVSTCAVTITWSQYIELLPFYWYLASLLSLAHQKSEEVKTSHTVFLSCSGKFMISYSPCLTPLVIQCAKQDFWWLPRQLMRTRSCLHSDSLWSVSSLILLQTAVKPLGSHHLTFSYHNSAQMLPWIQKD